MDNSATISYTLATGTLHAYLGRSVSATGHSFRTGGLCRVAISNVAQTSFPAAPGASGLIGLYTFASVPLMQSAPKPYIVYQDSGIYNEPLYANFRYDITSPFGIYAADGQVPTIQYQKGALPGAYGANNAARVIPSNGPNYYVAKTGSDSNPGTSGSPFATITKALSVITTGQVIQVQDSGIYAADYTLPNFNCILQAANGQSPTLLTAGLGTAAIHFSAGGANTYIINGFSLNGQGSLGALCGAAAATFTFSDCTIRNYAYLQDTTATITVNWTRDALLFFLAPQPGTGTETNTFTGCYLATDPQSNGTPVAASFPAVTSMFNCTVANYGVAPVPGAGGHLPLPRERLQQRLSGRLQRRGQRHGPGRQRLL